MISERIVGVFLFALAVAYGLLARGYTSDFTSDPLGPSAFPKLLAVLLGLASIYLIARPGSEPGWPRGRTLLHQVLAVIVLTMVFFGVLGYLLRKLGISLVPIVLGLVLGQPMEMNLRRALNLSDGDWTALFSSPLSIALSVGAVLGLVLPFVRRRRST